MYEINNLTFRYMLSDRNSLKQVSLKIKKGKITLIAGPSGSGKTTLLRHLKKELMPKGERSGDISYDHQRLEQLDDLRSIKEIAYLFQNPSAQMVMDTVWHEIAFGLENTGMLYEQMKRTVAEIVNYFDLQKIYHKSTDELSGGQKQMVNLAAVMAMHPKVLILDEPTAQLD
ncbi:energy-coupling factor ABC transporter ATP-binding protein, partial [Anaerostipes sp.]|uniref:energy-coupling factor ABC transporter ATP-binding protein n=1 Tax=Anaerostipes sp. TaxID=1872530 RepID=UPI00396778CE